MLEYILKVIVIMLVLFLFIVPGFVLRKCKLLPSSALPALSNILLYACQPALAVKAFCIDPIAPTIDVLLGIAWCIGLSCAGLFLVFGIAKLCFFRCKDRKRADVYIFLSVFSNCGFIGVPFVDMLTDGDSEALIYMTCFNVAFNAIVWTIGVYLMTQNFKDINFRRAFLNPSSAAAIVALILFIFPAINVFNMEGISELSLFVEDLSAMTAPLSMIIVGVRLAEIPFAELFNQKLLYPTAVVRLIAAPALMYLLGWLISLTGVLAAYSPYVWIAPVIAMAMSPAASVVAYAERFGGECQTATRGFILLTLLSIFTIPVVIALLA